ncbi:MAG: GNAT family N-acetyltransferase [Candidatus Izimaplasma sp.]|nr:GNAT family N-acetyltransferase [Candidatus Izimaplasma bacterium]
MIRKLAEKDRDKVLKYLYQEPGYNIFIIGDIETFGFEQDFQRIYADIDDAGSYISVFLRYRENAIFYSHNNYFNKDYLRIFEDDPFQVISGKKSMTEVIEPYLKNFKKIKMYFCEAKKLKMPLIKHRFKIKEIKTEAECEKLFDLISQIEEFAIFKNNRSDFIESKMKSIQMGTTLYIENKGKIISTVATTAETKKSAMVVSVATDPKYRNNGYASLLMQELMQRYFTDLQKSLCLFYDNVNAGKIYLRLGFETIGEWNIYRKID